MNIEIKTKNLTLTEALKKFTEEKIGSLKKFAKMSEILVFLEKETRHHRKGEIFKTKAEIIFPGKKIMAEGEGDDLLLTVVEVKDKLQQEIKKYKTKKIDTRRRVKEL